MVYSEDGYIVTNNHVIEGASNIKVTLHDGTEYPATLVAADSLTDVAVIKIDATDLPAVKFGDMDDLNVGDAVVAIGNPLGTLSGTATEGIVSALEREITIDGKQMTLIQTSASINPGNSGGGMFDGSGQLIGIVVAKSSGTGIEGLGFAIPVNTVSKAVDNIMNGGGDDTSSTQEEQNSQNSQDQYGSGQDQYGGGQDQYGQDPFSQDPFGGSDIFEFFGF